MNLTYNFLKFFSSFSLVSFSSLRSAFEVLSIFSFFLPVFALPVFFLPLHAFLWHVSRQQFSRKMLAWLKTAEGVMVEVVVESVKSLLSILFVG